MIYAAILAGGSGTRMHISSLPKQFLNLQGKPIIIHTLEKMLMCNRFHAVYLGIHPGWMAYMYDLLEKYDLSEDKRIKLAPGGSDRNDTIFNVIEEIDKDFGAQEDDIIVTHDAVRPFVTIRMIEENIDAANQYGACDTVVPATDTIVISHDGVDVSEIPNRNYMYQGQTPQSFNVKMLKELYDKVKPKDRETLTDACKIFVVNDVPVKLIQGEILNMKITTVNDYEIAQVIAGGITID
ncbi:D-ribitol-5-phosphate cytidylyltransferase [Clostridia bacterium]|nr:D-ribitol-5-phosphate cytidylyltransferase [Clostridia bacterium]